jgi:Tol biopolymer transport system component/DNA-binding winged helix-turn-helix (wHTH) protein
MTVRFGDFDLNTSDCRLVCKGQEVRLARQPLDLLIFLVKRRGELVTREDICAALWGNAAFEGGDHSINTTMRKIRAALGDDSNTPRYIETVVRRGYRFIAPVTMCEEEPARPAMPIPASAPELRAAQPSPRRRWVRLALAGAGCAAALALALGAALPALRDSRKQDSQLPQLEWKPITKATHSVTGLASDGRNIYWTEYAESGCRPWRVPVDGGAEAAPVVLPFPGSAFVTDASPDGRLLLSVRDICKTWDPQKTQGALWETTPASGQTRRIGNLTGRAAAYSPDGHRVAVGHLDELWVANRDGSDAHSIARVPGAIKTIRWSRDGKLVRFPVQRNTEIRYAIWETEIESQTTRPLPLNWDEGTDALDGTWTTDGQYVFGAKCKFNTNLWRMTAENQPPSELTPRQLTHGPLDFSEPAVIPGRSQIAVVGTQKQGELQRFDSRIGRFVPFLKGISAEMVDFSRDGEWVVYVTYPERELWRSRADGSSALQLTHGSLRAGLPRISPDNRLVAFTGDHYGKDLRTWIAPLSGGEPRLAAQSAMGTAEVAPTWSPDGAKLLFRLDLAVDRNVLAVLEVASGRLERIPGSEQKFNQRWSPDGRWIAATPNSNRGLEVYDIARREWRSLTAMNADYPNWSHDSKFLYFCSELGGGEEAIYRVSRISNKVERVTSLLGTQRAFDEVYSQWMGLAPDHSPLILKSSDLQRIYLVSFSGN